MVNRFLLSTVLCVGGLVGGLNLGTPEVAHGATPAPEATPPPATVIAQQPSGYTVIYVNANAGDDRRGNGSQMRPFQTITHALTIAQPNTVIVLAAGIYSDRSGEQFPIQLRPGITLQGNPSPNLAEVVIQGTSSYLTPSQGLRNVTLLGADGAGLANVTVNNPHPNGHGLWIEAGSPVILQSAFVGSGATGIYIAGAGSPIIQGNFFLENGQAGLVINGPSSAQVQGNIFENTGTGIVVAPAATPQIQGNRITRNQDGLVLHADAQPILSNNQISDNRRNSVLDYAPWPQASPGAVPVAAAPPPSSPAINLAATPEAPAPTEVAALPNIPESAAAPTTLRDPEPAALQAPVEEIPIAPRATRPPASVTVPPPITPLDAATQSPTPSSGDAIPVEIAVSSPPEAETAEVNTEIADRQASLRARIQANRAAQQAAAVANDTVGADAIEIAVIPPPASSAPVAPSVGDLPPVPSSATALLPTPSTAPQGSLSSNILTVPSASIPVGNGGSAPSVVLGTLTPGGPPPPPSRASSLGLYYRVFVEADDEAARTRLRSLVPDTFQVRVNGRAMMQAGAFNTQEEAQRTADWLNASGFRAQVEYTP